MNDTNSQSVVFDIRKVYLKDCSFESPQAPLVFTKGEQNPVIDIQMRIDHKVLDSDNGFYEVILITTVTAHLEQQTVFLVEVQQAGVFQIKNVPADELPLTLEIACPNILLPFAREAISDLVGKGGFPQLLINPVNFGALFQNKQNELARKGADQKADRGNGSSRSPDKKVN